MQSKSVLNILVLNVKKLFYKKASLLVFLIGVLIIGAPSYYFTNSLQIIGNLGKTFYYSEVILTVIIALLFGLFLASSFYKFQYFSVKKYGVGMFGAFVGIVVSGCPACSITLASYIGLASILSVFPYYGLELKLLSVLMLLYANFSIVKNLETCKIKK